MGEDMSFKKYAEARSDRPYSDNGKDFRFKT